MIIQSAVMALRPLLTPPYRAVLWKSLGLAAVALVLLWFGLTWIVDWLALPWLDALFPDTEAGQRWEGWFGFLAAVLAGIGIAVGLSLLIAPVTALIAGLFLDDVAELVERGDYPADPPGRALPIGQAIAQSLGFFAIVVVGNVVALLLLFVPGVNLVAFFLVNGYLLGREFFEFAAMRFRPQDEARQLRRDHAGTVLLAGLVIAALLAVPVLNLLAPLFAATFMVHLHKAISRKTARA